MVDICWDGHANALSCLARALFWCDGMFFVVIYRWLEVAEAVVGYVCSGFVFVVTFRMAVDTFDRVSQRFSREMEGVYCWIREEIDMEGDMEGMTVLEDKLRVLWFGLNTCRKHGTVWGSSELSPLGRKRVYVFVLLLEEMVREMLVSGSWLGGYVGEVRSLLAGLSDIRRELEGMVMAVGEQG